MATLLIDRSHDYTSETLSGITGFDVRPSGEIRVTFSSSQFDNVQISQNLEVYLEFAALFYIEVKTNGQFSAANWTFLGQRDFINLQIEGGSGDDIATGSYLDDRFYNSPGKDELHGGNGDDEFITSPYQLAAGDLFDGGAGDDELFCQTSPVGDDAYTDLTGAILTSIEKLTVQADVTVTGHQLRDSGLQTVALPATYSLTVNGPDTDLGGLTFTTGASVGTLTLDGLDDSANVLIGSRHDDLVNGGTRADPLSGGDANDHLVGDSGDDTLSGDAGDDVLDGDAGLDVASYASATAAVHVDLSRSGAQDTGGAGADDLHSIEGLTGSAFADVLTGAATNDVLRGGGGNDSLNGGDADDALFGGDGDDLLDGGTGFDGDDAFDGGDGIDTVSYRSIVTGVGVHVDLSLGGAQDTSAGGHDSFVGIENIVGTNSNDTITGNSGANVIDGGGGTSDNDALNGGTGLDTVSYAHAVSAVTVSLRDGTADGGGGHDALTSFENVIGSAYADTITGTDRFRFATGANVLSGGGGLDTLIGLSGDDTYILDGVALNDDPIPRQVYDRVVEAANGGTDTIRITRVAGLVATYTIPGNVENLVIEAAGALSIIGNALNNVITGNAADNSLSGGDGDDELDGGLGMDRVTYGGASAGVTVDLSLTAQQDTIGAGRDTLSGFENVSGSAFADTLTGNGGANLIDGAAGADTMAGGAGNDTYIVDDAGDRVVEQNKAGVDGVMASVSFQIGRGVEYLTLTGDGDLDGTGNNLANTIVGTIGDNSLDGGGGADRLIGGAGNDLYIVDDGRDFIVELAFDGLDTAEASASFVLPANVDNLELSGHSAIDGAGNTLANRITGNSAANVITGGGGGDILNGRGGADTFRYLAIGDSGVDETQRDTIKDFSHSQGDRIDLQQIDADTTRTGDQAFVFIGAAAFDGTPGEVRVRAAGANTLVLGDIDGDKQPDFAILLSGHVALVGTDFAL